MNELSIIEQVVIQGDLAQLSSPQRVEYYNRVCESLNLNPLTNPFRYLQLNGKLVLYATKDCTEQLRKRDGVSISIVAREAIEGVYVVTARATNAAGRSDESIGAVALENLRGELRANAMMKAETKAKRRVTLSFAGLGMLDESEVSSIPEARIVTVSDRGDIAGQQPTLPEPQRQRTVAPPAEPAVDKQRKLKLDRAAAMLRNPKLPQSFRDNTDLDTIADDELDDVIKAMVDALNKPAAPITDNDLSF